MTEDVEIHRIEKSTFTLALYNCEVIKGDAGTELS